MQHSIFSNTITVRPGVPRYLYAFLLYFGLLELNVFYFLLENFCKQTIKQIFIFTRWSNLKIQGKSPNTYNCYFCKFVCEHFVFLRYPSILSNKMLFFWVNYISLRDKLSPNLLCVCVIIQCLKQEVLINLEHSFLTNFHLSIWI